MDRTRIFKAAATNRPPDKDTELDRQVEEAYATLLARYAPETQVRRVAWSQGETQVLELRAGPPLLLVHGGGGSAFEWVPILQALARNHRVLAVDRPGHGLADPFDYRGVDLLEHARTFLRDVLDALELRGVEIVANSIGGLWCVAFALVAPERVSRLALVGRRLGRLLLSNPTRDSSRKFWGQLLVAHPERLDKSLLDADVAHMRRNRESVIGLMQCVVGVGGLRRHLLLGERWQEVKVPTVFLWGERDAFMTPEMREAWEAIASRNPNLSIIRVPDAGHLPWIDAPERVVDEIEAFLAS
jgi:pimeloyl-ACP methyl ester carboxylesterase